MIGEASGPAEAFGVRAGMRLGEALARCPELSLVPPDPERAESAWERALRHLEGIGAEVEPARPGEAFFEAAGLVGLVAEAWRGCCGGRGEAVGPGVRLGAGADPALRLRRRAPVATPPGADDRPRGDDARLPRHACRWTCSATGSRTAAPLRRSSGGGAHRLRGPAGEAASASASRRWASSRRSPMRRSPIASARSACGRCGWPAARTSPLRPRRPHEDLVERLELPEAISGPQLERALSLLVDRLLANPVRRERSLRRLRLAARLAGGGSWRTVVALRRASADPERLRLALLGKLAELPGPATSLSLLALETGPPARRPGGARRAKRAARDASGSPRRFARRGRSPERTR